MTWECLNRFFFITTLQTNTRLTRNDTVEKAVNHYWFIDFIEFNLSITYEIYRPFNDRFEVRSVILEILTVFNKVCHQQIIFRLRLKRHMLTKTKLLNILSDFISIENKWSYSMVNLFLSKHYRRSSPGIYSSPV